MTPRPHRLALNGKWLGQELTGTQRYAREVTRHLLPLLPDRPVVHVPASAAVPDWLEDAVELRRSRLSGTAFEQLAMPWAARRDLLLSLGGAAPLLARHQVATMHDATPFRLPHTYSRVLGPGTGSCTGSLSAAPPGSPPSQGSADASWQTSWASPSTGSSSSPTGSTMSNR